MAAVGDWSPKLKDNEGKPVPKPSPPDLLKLAWNCKEWNSLPNKGGVLDQKIGLMDRLTTIVNVYDAMKMWRNTKPDDVSKFIENMPDTYETVQMIWNLRKENGTK